jgi:septal ring factor EnvC (AmiA/AmiB activator)
MNTLRTAVAVVGLAALGAAQDVNPVRTVSRLAESSEAQLNRSIAELNALRDEIATEKIPLAKELGDLETKVASLRKESDRIARTVDSADLEQAAVKAEMKARQDELGLRLEPPRRIRAHVRDEGRRVRTSGVRRRDGGREAGRREQTRFPRRESSDGRPPSPA